MNKELLKNAIVGGESRITLGRNYVPPNLIDLKQAVPNAFYPYYDVEIAKEAIKPIQDFVNDLIQHGYVPYITYGYRSYELQEQLHHDLPNDAASPGASQHQLGITIDIHSYAKIDSNGNIQWYQACTDIGVPECEPTILAIQLAAKHGIAHPLAWDRPHFFVAKAVFPTINNYLQSIENPVYSTYYNELNAKIAQIQQECL